VARGRSRRGGSRIAAVLFLAGCFGVLAVTFMLGVVTGRFWPRTPSVPLSVVAKGAREPSRPAEPAPALTFYQELTAPLSSPPPPKPSRPPRVEPPRAESPRVESDKPDATPKADAVAAAPAKPAPGQPTFTVQVAAYKAKDPADALRAKLTAAGYEAYVVQVDTPGSARYRVRVGSFAARESAQQIADRIVGERSLPAFVTSR
jgi:cell division septation protein DedD